MKKREWIIVAVLLAVCIAAAFFLYRPKQATNGVVAVISVDGEELRRIDLSSDDAYTFRIEEETGKPVSFEVQDGRIRFVDVTCPDHLCEQTGWCQNPGDRAVCLPNRTSLICYDKASL